LAGAVANLISAHRFLWPSTAAAWSSVRFLSLVCNDPRFPGLKLTLTAYPVCALRKRHGIVLFVLNPSRSGVNSKMSDVKTIRNVMSQTIIPEHHHPVVDSVAVPGCFTFQENGRTVRPRIDGHARHRDIGNSFDEQIALRVQQTHYALLF
jgi:hypothetical protein